MTRVLVIAVAVVALLATAVLWQCSRTRSPKVLPSKSFAAAGSQFTAQLVEVGPALLRMEIRDQKGEVVARSSRNASAYSTFFIDAQNDAAWFYSGDIGFYVFLRSADGQWIEEAYDRFRHPSLSDEFKTRLGHRAR